MFGGDIQATDASLPSPSAGYMDNFVPVPIDVSANGKIIRYVKRRGYQNKLDSGQLASYFFSYGAQWTGVPGTVSALTSRGLIVYTAEKENTDLKLYKWDNSSTLLGTFATANYRCIGIQETLISGVANLVLTVRNTSSPYDQKMLYFPNGKSFGTVNDNFELSFVARFSTERLPPK